MEKKKKKEDDCITHIQPLKTLCALSEVGKEDTASE